MTTSRRVRLEETPQVIKFGLWLEAAEAPLSVALSRVYGWKPKIEESLEDVREGRLSYSTSKPVEVSRLDAPRGHFYLIDGYHRVIEAILAGKTSISGTVSQHIPRIERTGGAYRSYLEDKILITDVVRRESPNHRAS